MDGHLRLVKRFGDDEIPAVREQVTSALVDKGRILVRMGDEEDALAVCDALLGRFGDEDSSEAREAVATALANKGFLLQRLGRDEDALNACDALIQRLADDQVTEVREIVADGLSSTCEVLCRRWRITHEAPLLERAISAGRRCVAMGGNPYSLACSLALAGQLDEAFQILEGCLRDSQTSTNKKLG